MSPTYDPRRPPLQAPRASIPPNSARKSPSCHHCETSYKGRRAVIRSSPEVGASTGSDGRGGLVHGLLARWPALGVSPQREGIGDPFLQRNQFPVPERVRAPGGPRCHQQEKLYGIQPQYHMPPRPSSRKLVPSVTSAVSSTSGGDVDSHPKVDKAMAVAQSRPPGTTPLCLPDRHATRRRVPHSAGAHGLA